MRRARGVVLGRSFTRALAQAPCPHADMSTTPRVVGLVLSSPVIGRFIPFNHVEPPAGSEGRVKPSPLGDRPTARSHAQA